MVPLLGVEVHGLVDHQGQGVGQRRVGLEDGDHLDEAVLGEPPGAVLGLRQGRLSGDHVVEDAAHEVDVAPRVVPANAGCPLQRGIVDGSRVAVGAVLAGLIGYNAFVGDGREAFWGEAIRVLADNDTIEGAHHVPLWVKLLPLAMAVSGIGLAYVMYMLRPDLPGAVVRMVRPIHTFFFNKWFFDELYDWIFVRPAVYLGYGFWKAGDGAVIDFLNVGIGGLRTGIFNLADVAIVTGVSLLILSGLFHRNAKQSSATSRCE